MSRIRLTWTNASTTIVEQRVYRSITPLDIDDMPDPLAVLPRRDREYLDSTIEDGLAYYYAVSSVLPDYSELISEEIKVEATPGESDPYWDNVVALLHFDDNFLETSGKTECNGFDGASISKSVFKFGEGSLYLDGAGPYATLSGAPLALGVGDFTIELFAKRNGWSTHVSGEIFLLDTRSGGSNQMLLDINSSSQRLLRYYWGGSARISVVDAVGIDFVHIAIARSNGQSRMFVDGVQVGLAPDTHNFTSTDWRIGGRFELYQGSRLSWNGNIDELRITKGVARYTENFTPPTGPFPNN